MKKNRKFKLTFILLGILLVILAFQNPWCHFKVPAVISKTSSSAMEPFKSLFRRFRFNKKDALKEWQEKIFKGRVLYEVELNGLQGYLHSKSAKTASAIFYRIKFNLTEYPYIYWKWRVGKFPKKESGQSATQRDDYAARVYIIFASRFFTNFKCVEYVWDETLPEGTSLISPYSDQIRQLVVHSGTIQPGEWIAEKRNVLEDYLKLFGQKPTSKVAAIALMTDSEGTGSEAEGYFDDIQIGAEAQKAQV